MIAWKIIATQVMITCRVVGSHASIIKASPYALAANSAGGAMERKYTTPR
jgi:hypothetical protein